MKLISWNVNGLRACLGKGFSDYFTRQDADFFCLQETKMQPGQADLQTPNHHAFWNSAERKGYSGTAIFAKRQPLGRHLWHGQRPARPRRPAHHAGIRELFPRDGLHPPTASVN